jgi:hypothetical protein
MTCTVVAASAALAVAGFAQFNPEGVAVYLFDGDLTDGSANANHGSLAEGTESYTGSGNVPFPAEYPPENVGLALNGSSAIEVPADASMSTRTNSFTVEAWVMRLAANQSAFSKRTAGEADNWELVTGSDANPIRWILGADGGSIELAHNVFGNFGVWHHYALVVDRSADEAYFYYDGLAVDTNSIAGAGDLDRADPGHPLIIGASTSLGDPYVSNLNGNIDEFRIVGRALSAAEILLDFQNSIRVDPTAQAFIGLQPQAMWLFDQDIDDNTGHGVDLSNVNSGSELYSTNVPPIAGADYPGNRSFNFELDTQSLESGSPNTPGRTFIDAASNNFTVSFWISRDDTNSTRIILEKRDPGDLEKWSFILWGPGQIDPAERHKMRFVLEDTDLLFTSNVDITGGPVLGLDEWHHVAGVVDRDAETATLYVDGANAGSASIADFTNTDENNVLRMSGSKQLSGTTVQKMDAHLDEVAYFQRALTQSEITHLSQNSLLVAPPTVAGVSQVTVSNQVEVSADSRLFLDMNLSATDDLTVGVYTNVGQAVIGTDTPAFYYEDVGASTTRFYSVGTDETDLRRIAR